MRWRIALGRVYLRVHLLMVRVHVIEGTVKSVVRNKSTGQVLGVEYARKGQEYREFVLL
jgi:hypothetical protein